MGGYTGNRPGYPFLGNDFFGEMGDVFACYVIDNPDSKSEIELLSKYGPDIDMDVIKRLIGAFNDVRKLNDDGIISYPYSTRELVNIVRHLQKYPQDTIGSVLKNVFDFDKFDYELLKLLYDIFHKHRIPLLASDEFQTSELLHIPVCFSLLPPPLFPFFSPFHWYLSLPLCTSPFPLPFPLYLSIPLLPFLCG